MTNNTILFNAVVIDNEDPLMLGRVRARFLNPPSDMGSYEDITRSINNPIWSEEDDKWTSRDPFIFLPLIPYFLYQVPKVDEFIQLIYLNKDFKFQNQYYILSNFSTPTATKFETIGFQECISKNLKVMDMTAFTLCMENKLPIIVFDMNKPGNLLKVVEGMQVGTLVG